MRKTINSYVTTEQLNILIHFIFLFVRGIKIRLSQVVEEQDISIYKILPEKFQTLPGTESNFKRYVFSTPLYKGSV